jgi:isoquinoline 1-oxidoreductase alpha subunit
MVSLSVNGEQHSFEGDTAMPVLWYVRDGLGLTGTKYGCGTGLCGACTIHVDGQAVRSCLAAIADVVGKAVVTIEGLDPSGDHPVQKAWREHNVPQCGFCQVGQIMQAAALVSESKSLSDDQITEGMAGNICRCGCYERIHTAVRAVAGGV